MGGGGSPAFGGTPNHHVEIAVAFPTHSTCRWIPTCAHSSQAIKAGFAGLDLQDAADHADGVQRIQAGDNAYETRPTFVLTQDLLCRIADSRLCGIHCDAP